MNQDDRLQRDLASLPERDAEAALAARVRRQAQARLALERTRLESPWTGRLLIAGWLWTRVGMPVALASVVGVYLTWAFRFAEALYR